MKLSLKIKIAYHLFCLDEFYKIAIGLSHLHTFEAVFYHLKGKLHWKDRI